ncbi:DNA translocase FtsK 4TM domain-containing protein [Alphaproteobacteria bacterium]|nr:DNA translocase FtsK 4TM domain-containing protein [Alphaproteobacteria bacterium]
MFSKLKKINIKYTIYKFLISIFLMFLISVLVISLYTHNDFDPSFFTVNDEPPINALGIFGSNLSSVLLVFLGDASWLLPIFMIFLIRIVVINEFNFLNLFLRLFGIVFCITVLSISLIKVNLDPGIFGKVVIGKFRAIGKEINKYESLILILNLLVFSYFLVLLVSRTKNGIFVFFYRILKFFLLFTRKIFLLFFYREKIFKKNTKALKNEAFKQKKITINNKFNYVLPSLDFLDDVKVSKKLRGEDIDIQSKNLNKVLDDYGIKGSVVNVQEGPVVTRYELEPAPGTRSSRIISLSDDIARSMSAKSTRVSVLYGKNAIGIELPNKNIDVVFLKEILSTEYFLNSEGLSIALGKDISGNPLIADLSKMPHLLVAGTTGSGKSVSINAMILSLLYKYSDTQCKFILIDPKMLELSVYEGIPHLLHPVVTEPRKAVFALKWAVKEMNERYKQMSTLNVRNIDSYNKIVSKKEYKEGKLVKKIQIGFDATSGKPIYQNKEIDVKPFPFIVIVVDEMADLMLAAGKEIEVSIQSLAQKARAAGIHLILATQRPSVDVITGTIKANLPYRISFQVTSKIDSRTILGEQGAEQLLGRGDMLFMAGGGYTERVHGPFVSDQEILKVTNYIKSQGEPDYQHYITQGEDEDSDSSKTEEEFDPLYDRALSLIKKERKVSTSFLQRHFAIGYNRAARIVDSFEKKGIVSSANSMGRREVLIDE